MTYQELAFSTSCLRHYRCDEAGGDVAIDSSIMGVSGSYLGGSIATGGRFGLGRISADGRVLRADELRLDEFASCTLAAWVKWSETTASRTLFVSESVNRPLMFASTRSDELGLFLNQRGGFRGCGFFPVDWQVGEWRHLAVTCDSVAGQSRFFVDGVHVGAVSQQFLVDSSGQLHVGNLPLGGGASQPVGEAIDDVFVFDRVLSDAEISELAAGPEPTNLSPPSLTTTPVAGESVPRDPGVWADGDNGVLTFTTRFQIRSDEVAPWQDVAGSEAASFVLSTSHAGLFLRAVSTATNDGGESQQAFGEPALVLAAHYRAIAAASVGAAGIVEGAVLTPIAPAAGAVFSNTGGLS